MQVINLKEERNKLIGSCERNEEEIHVLKKTTKELTLKLEKSMNQKEDVQPSSEVSKS